MTQLLIGSAPSAASLASPFASTPPVLSTAADAAEELEARMAIKAAAEKREAALTAQLAATEKREAALTVELGNANKLIDKFRQDLPHTIEFTRKTTIEEYHNEQAMRQLQTEADECADGYVVAVAEISLYSFGSAGCSACTTISCFAALELLKRYYLFGSSLISRPGGFALTSPSLVPEELRTSLSRVVEQGVEGHTQAAHELVRTCTQHLASDEVMDALPKEHAIREKLCRGRGCDTYLLVPGVEQEACFMRALAPAKAPHKAVGYVLTKPPETVLCIIGADAAAPCFMFDSHPHQSRNIMGAHLLRFGGLQSLCAALCRRFPVLSVTDENVAEGWQQLWQQEYLRQITAMPLMLTLPLTENQCAAGSSISGWQRVTLTAPGT